MFSFAHPFVLLVLVALAAILLVVALPGRAGGRSRRRRRVLVTGCMCLAPVLLVLALAGPQFGPASPRPTVLAVDQSASVSAQARRIERRWINGAREDDCVSPCRIVRFAGAPRVTPAKPPRGARSASERVPDTTRTDLQSALQAAVGLVPHHGRVVVLGDGGQTQDDLLAAAPAAVAGDVRVDWVRLPDSRAPDASVTSLSAPAAVRRGDSVPLTLTIHSTVAGAASLQIRSGDSAPRQQVVQLRAGDNPLLLFYKASHSGWQSFEATVSLRGGDAEPQNNSMWVTTHVLGPPSVLVVGAGDAALNGVLSNAKLRTTSAAPSRLPNTVGGYRRLDAVVLDDVSAKQLTSAQITALSTAVKRDGLGLVVIGGPHSFSLGHYAKSGLQHLLPVASLVPGNLQRRNVAIELVLDHSGSMIDEAGGVPKILMSHAAAADSASFIAKHKDQIGIVDFDIRAHTLIQLQRLTTKASEKKVVDKVDGLHADGGTNIIAGLRAGYEELRKSKAPERHMILMTDGISQPDNYAALLKQLKAAHITVATVALGSDADRKLLRRIASGTGGRAYATDNAKQLPKIFAKETQLSAKPVKVKGRLTVTARGDSPVVRSLAGTKLPGLRGNVVTNLRPGAQADLVASDARQRTDPVLAEWQIGGGRVVAWTAGLGAPWARAWTNKRELWNDAIRWTQRAPSAPTLMPHPVAGFPGVLEIDLAAAGSRALSVTGITGSLTGLSGFSLPVKFAHVGPGIFRADVSGLPPSVYHYQLATQGSLSRRESGEVAIQYPAEFSATSTTTSPLGQLVKQTGGRLLKPGDEAEITESTESLGRLLGLVALLVFCAGVALRMLPRLRRRTGDSPSEGEPVATPDELVAEKTMVA